MKIATIMVCLIIVAGCSDKKMKESSERQLEAKQAAQIKSVIDRLVVKHNALYWKNTFDAAHAPRIPFSIDVQDALQPTNGSPVVLVERLYDLTRRNGQFQMRLLQDEYPKIYFALGCTAEQADMIRKHKFAEKLAVVAIIKSVYVPPLEAIAQAEDDRGVWIDLEASDRLLATGQCIDLVFFE